MRRPPLVLSSLTPNCYRYAAGMLFVECPTCARLVRAQRSTLVPHPAGTARPVDRGRRPNCSGTGQPIRVDVDAETWQYLDMVAAADAATRRRPTGRPAPRSIFWESSR